jgi:hydroxypyruvate isomerase
MRFAANLSMMFGEHGFMERFAAAALAGFDAVEYLFPYEFAAKELRARLDATGLEQALFNAPPGDWAKGERGLACLPGREQEFRDGIARALDYAGVLGCGRIHAMAGVVPEGADPVRLEATYIANIAWAAGQAEEAGVELLIEPINRIDMPGYFLHDFAQALGLIAMSAEAGAPPGLQFDIYHCARMYGPDAVLAWAERCRPVIGHYQIAGTPARNEPDRGDLPCLTLIPALEALTPGLFCGCEYRPAGRTEDGLGWLRRPGWL